MFTNSDKDNTAVCLYKSFCYEKRNNNYLLSDTSTYTQLTKNPLKDLQSNTSKMLKYFNHNDFFKYKYHNNQLTLTDSSITKCYG